ncbi:MAG: hypothetical protein U1C46_03005 [Bacteroidales bacterium]|nr:hypothetical protein [Bacteroidales bacterium]MDZ4203767.1 hypothetical protein [Bacteroidales bacterium]
MNLKLLVVLLLFSGMSCSLQAQEKQYRFMVMGVPQQMFFHGIRIELDLAQKKEHHWITIAPQFYFSNHGSNGILSNNNFEKLFGGGIDIFSRHYLSRKKSASGAYLSWGGGYRYLNLNTTDYLWSTFQENGLVYYRRQHTNYDVQIHSLSARGVAGWQFFIQEQMAVDVYFGFGLRFSSHQRPQGSFVTYNSSAFDYGYTGTLVVGGLRFGLGW